MYLQASVCSWHGLLTSIELAHSCCCNDAIGCVICPTMVSRCDGVRIVQGLYGRSRPWLVITLRNTVYRSLTCADACP
jgi:hypothetical protein